MPEEPAQGPPLGKLSPEAFAQWVAPHLGADRVEVAVGPRVGHDAAIVRIGAGRVMAVTTDPLSVIPALGLERSARLACHLIASDLWTTGIPPAYVSVDFNLPPSFGDDAFGRYWRAMSEEWAKLGVAVITGHTGRHEGCGENIIGAATLIGVGDEGRYLTPGMARAGDQVVVTKGCAIETAAIAVLAWPEKLRAHVDEEGMAFLQKLETQVSVVADCRAAMRAGVRERGVTAMHDATEGGVLGGLLELAKACDHDVRVDRARLVLAKPVAAACDALGVDPYWTLSEGTLIACAKPARALLVVHELEEDGIPAAIVGEVLPGHGKLWVGEPDGGVSTFDTPKSDPWWEAYARALREGWR
jgi:hydrogenase expression/formation protein HypE